MVKIVSDSTCDLSAELIRRTGVNILPLHVLLGDKEYLDGVNITPYDIFAWSDQNKTTPKTSAISTAEAMDALRPLLQDGDSLVCFTVAGKMSVTCQNIRMAAKELHAEDRIAVIDSCNLSTGIGLLIMETADMIAQGADLNAIKARMDELIPRVRSSFVVDTLTYLHRGGRCSGLAALAGSALRLHPRISVTNGAMAAGKKYRGRMNRVLLEYAQDLHEELLHADPKRVFITSAACDPETVAAIRTQLTAMNRFTEILETTAGSVVSSHCGPGVLGILYIAE